jgi:hypothetical protein
MDSKCSGRVPSSFLPLLFLPLALLGQKAQEKVVPLRNWQTPLYWQANQAEREGTVRAVPQLQFSANALSTTPLTFVAITPCRLVDTRGAAAGFNGITPFSGPPIPGGGTLTIPVQSAAEATANTAPAPCGVIPSIAQAYSLNVTVVPAGGGSVGYLSLWPAGSLQPVVASLNDTQGLIVANAAIVPAGTPSGGISVFNDGPATTDVVIDMNGYFAAPTNLTGNTALGTGALASNSTGDHNTATGFAALQGNITGAGNTASGAYALQNNTAGGTNTADGELALESNTTGSGNTATGFAALGANTTGAANTASGVSALGGNTTGSNNIAIGQGAGLSVSSGNSNNIHIGSSGVAGDSGAIRIGTAVPLTSCAPCAPQTSFFVAAVRGVTTGNNNAVSVVIDSNGQLGTVNSSRRFKEDIEDMGAVSQDLMRLRPVTFRYKEPFADGSKPIQYGLIAEEVAEVYAELVAHSADGQIETVKYQVLDSMLLNELQKQHRQVEQQTAVIRLLETRLAALEQALASKAPLPTPAGR